MKKLDMIAQTPIPPYYAEIFSSTSTEGNNGYSEIADKMVELAKQQKGFLGVEIARNKLGDNCFILGRFEFN